MTPVIVNAPKAPVDNKKIAVQLAKQLAIRITLGVVATVAVTLISAVVLDAIVPDETAE